VVLSDTKGEVRAGSWASRGAFISIPPRGACQATGTRRSEEAHHRGAPVKVGHVALWKFIIN